MYCHIPLMFPLCGIKLWIQFISRETHKRILPPTVSHTAGEVLAIMSLDCPEGEPLSFYRTFVNHVWNVFQCVCRDVGELRHLVRSLLVQRYIYCSGQLRTLAEEKSQIAMYNYGPAVQTVP